MIIVSVHTGSLPITFPYAALIDFAITAIGNVTSVTFLVFLLRFHMRHLKEQALDRTMWRARFGRGLGPVVRQTTK
jgi:hypothetical protein